MDILPGTGRWQAEGLTEGIPPWDSFAAIPLHHASHGPPVPGRMAYT